MIILMLLLYTIIINITSSITIIIISSYRLWKHFMPYKARVVPFSDDRLSYIFG